MELGKKDFTVEEVTGFPIVDIVNYFIHKGLTERASDIHFEPFGDQFKIRYRIDGQCVEAAAPPKELNLALASRIKVMANLDVAETRLPQDGRILTNISGKTNCTGNSIIPNLLTDCY